MKSLLLDFRWYLIVLLFGVYMAGSNSQLAQNDLYDKRYLYTLILFSIFFLVGSYGTGKVNRYWRNSINKTYVTKDQLIFGRILFLLSQAYYLWTIALALKLGGFSSWHNLRFEVLSHINFYVSTFAFVFAVVCLSGELSVKPTEGTKEKLYSFIIVLLLIIESSIFGSRSRLIIILALVILHLIRNKSVSILFVLLSAGGGLVVVSGMAYLRISTDDGALSYFVKNNIIQEGAPIFKIAVSVIMNTINNMYLRGVTVVNYVLDGKLNLVYGYNTFYYFVTMMPGEQVAPGVFLNHQVFGGSLKDVGYPPTLVGQLVWDFSLWGVVCFGLLLGQIGKLSYACAVKLSHPIYTSVYVLLIIQFVFSVYGAFNLGFWLVNSLMAIIVSHLSIRSMANFRLLGRPAQAKI